MKLQGIKREGMSADDWDELDELAKSTIMLTLSKSVYFNVKDMKTSYELWQKLCDLYKQKTVASQVYWLKQLVRTISSIMVFPTFIAFHFRRG